MSKKENSVSAANGRQPMSMSIKAPANESKLSKVLASRNEHAGFDMSLGMGRDGEQSFEEARAAAYKHSKVHSATELKVQEPTMTINTRDALADIMGMFENQSLSAEDEYPEDEPTFTVRDFTIPLGENEIEKTCTIVVPTSLSQSQIPVKPAPQKFQVFCDDDDDDNNAPGDSKENQTAGNRRPALSLKTPIKPTDCDDPIQSNYRPLSIMTPITEVSAEYLPPSTLGSSHLSSRTFNNSCLTGFSKISSNDSNHTIHSQSSNTFHFSGKPGATNLTSTPHHRQKVSLDLHVDSILSSHDDIGQDDCIQWPCAALQKKWMESSVGSVYKTISEPSPYSKMFKNYKPNSSSVDLDGKSFMMQKFIGQGAYASVYSALDKDNNMVAIKIQKPSSAWEFHICTQLHDRLINPLSERLFIKPSHFTSFADESYMVMPMMELGSLLTSVNLIFANEDMGGGADETMAMFFACSLLRMIDAMHQSGVIHGDLKADNVFVRYDSDFTVKCDSILGDAAAVGVKCLDFGKSIDMRECDFTASFRSDIDVVSKDSILDQRLTFPWQWDIDFVGLAGIIHTMLFGKYWCSEIPSSEDGTWNQDFVWSLVEKWPLKRYWQKLMWLDLLRILLQSDHSFTMRWFRLREVRGRMERWLKENRMKIDDSQSLSTMLCRLRELSTAK